ncbi:hypothetical protein ACJMK2_043632 [Sinanodonta woodiana]|uniref:Phosphoenolpyruvate synthase n=1 Tax=Sinanodonta woodiana TaxID=1069815 RepID=A0ABD3VYB3_SINWO
MKQNRIDFHGFNEDENKITFSQYKVANIKKNRLTFRNSSGGGRRNRTKKTINRLFTRKMNLSVVEPLKKWRICFHDFLKSVAGEEKSIYASISFLWQCSSDPYEYVQNSSLWSFANLSTKRLMAYNELKRIITGQTFRFDQWGELCGTLDIEQSGENYFWFTSPRSRSFSKVNRKTHTIHYIKIKDKCWMLVLIKDSLYDFKSLSGYKAYPNRETWPLAFQGCHFKHNILHSKYDGKVFSGEIFKRYYVNDEAAFGCQVIEETQHIIFTMNIENAPTHTHVTGEVCNFILAILLEDTLSKRPDLVGGKGASLSKLLEIIHYCIRNKQIDQLHKCCDNATLTMAQTRMYDATQAILIDQLHTIFGSEYENKCLAVRSSAVGEDGIESSSAGQMETVLNVKGYDSIIQSILKCWASSLSFNIVEYRRQNGQRLMGPMAVVVLKMIKSEVSGVLFTADPLTNKGSTIVINAFPGLGEVVVSGKSDVDTIFITRTHDQHLNIRKRILAENKQERVKCTSEQDMCLKDKMVLKICQSAILIEAQFGVHMDIEWAVDERSVYIFQARPIVVVFGETGEDLMHEYNTPVTDWKACLTIGNIGEMLPGITTPLTIDLFGRAVDLAIKQMHQCEFPLRYSTYASLMVCTFYYRMFINLSSTADMFMTLFEHSMQNLVSFSGMKLSLLSKLKGFLKARFKTWRAEKILRSYEKMLEKSTTIHHSNDLNDQMEEIESNHEHYFEVWKATMYQNVQSAIGSAILMSVLCGKSNKITPDVSADLARLLSSRKNVYSADFPAALADLAEIINESNQKGYFINLPDEECHALLLSSEIFGETYRSFLDRHGHRCMREADFMELSWVMAPTKLIQCLKAFISHGLVNIRTEQQDIKEIVNNLRCPLTSFQTLLFRTFLVSLARKGVELETDVMVQESRLPEQDLLFYLTHREIKTLIETRSPELVRKSRKRRSITQALMFYSFQKVNYGAPIPLIMEVEISGSQTFEGQGMPVSRGIVTGRACVMKDISEVGQYVKETFLCLFTDVGWTPYFPLLSGTVTEIDGLLSHGAVVAREYGLPCIVCMSNTTKLFKTGDIVKLNATEGKLCKIEIQFKTSP